MSAPPLPARTVSNPLPPAEEKRLLDMARAQRAADGHAVGELLEWAGQQRPARFKVATMDIDYAPDGTPRAVAVCYWIGSNRLDADQDCKSLGWEIAPDRRGLKPYASADMVALENGRDAFLRDIDDYYAKACAGGRNC